MSFRNMAILTDVSKCIGCEACVDACQEANGLPEERPWRWLRSITDLSSARWTTIRRVRDERGMRYVRRQCRHCLEPACVEACIVGALTKSDDGPVVYNRDICIGCRYCMIVCPWEIPKYSWEDSVPYIQKCDFCHERVRNEGRQPACTEACPNEATIFGEREELLAEARRRLAAEPDRYVQRIWGEHEVGGSSVLYISDVDLNLTELPKPVTDQVPVPHRTYKVLHFTPHVFVGMATAMGGLQWVIERRQRLAAGEPPGPQKGTRGPQPTQPQAAGTNDSTAGSGEAEDEAI